MKTLPTLFKKTQTGAIQTWLKELDGPRHRTVTGQIEGVKTTSAWTECIGKNIGKANETTPEQQAELECQADYTKKLAQGGYYESIDDIENKGYVKPMLAKIFADKPISEKEFKSELIVSQPKLDGVRCIATAEGLFSRKGKPIESCPHIMAALAPVFAANPGLILDGELYADALAEDFNSLISLVKRQKSSPEDFAKAAESIEYHCYDLVSSGFNFIDRFAELQDILLKVAGDDSKIKIVESIIVNSQEELDELNVKYLQENFEGQMVRRNGPYRQNARSWDLLKRKEFLDEEFEIVGVFPGKGNRTDIAGFVTFRLKDGRTFGAGIKGSWEYAGELLKDADKYKNGVGTVRYFQLTPDGIPRFPIATTLYENKRDF